MQCAPQSKNKLSIPSIPLVTNWRGIQSILAIVCVAFQHVPTQKRRLNHASLQLVQKSMIAVLVPAALESTTRQLPSTSCVSLFWAQVALPVKSLLWASLPAAFLWSLPKICFPVFYRVLSVFHHKTLPIGHSFPLISCRHIELPCHFCLSVLFGISVAILWPF